MDRGRTCLDRGICSRASNHLVALCHRLICRRQRITVNRWNSRSGNTVNFLLRFKSHELGVLGITSQRYELTWKEPMHFTASDNVRIFRQSDFDAVRVGRGNDRKNGFAASAGVGRPGVALTSEGTLTDADRQPAIEYPPRNAFRSLRGTRRWVKIAPALFCFPEKDHHGGPYRNSCQRRTATVDR